MLRNIVAVILGLIVGMMVNMAFLQLNLVFYPMPEGTDMYDQKELNAYIETLPDTGFILVLAAHLGQAFVGGWLAARLARSKAMMLAMIVGILTLIGGIINMTMIPAPTWLYVEFPLYLVVAWLAGKLGQKRQTKQSTN